MTSSYWPDISEVRRCIKTEAEELSDTVLMAVHEPMKLERLAAGEAQTELVDESELLEHVIENNRPTPIIGQSGFGKSHVIRWLDVNLRRRGRDKDWHIVRIPKNASLKQALTILLTGLDGERFADARNKIETVGRGLNSRTVAQHLIVFVGARLEELYEESSRELEAARDSGIELTPDDARRAKIIRRHAKRNGLAALIGDPYFNEQLIDDGKCFHQIAKRFTEGSSDEEIEENVYQVEASDLEVNTQLGNLSLNAKTYVQYAQINTSEDMRNEAVALLNECLNDACREAFQQLFQFHSGSFQDLFQEIRRSLKDCGKTLFILVEDMATISAIEDVLIDSLVQEDVREGEQVLCPLHSAIAVTSGYHGYARKKDTLVTRAKYEWMIGKRIGSDENTYERIENFCGRYLNAARIGEEALSDSFPDFDGGESWPGVWESRDKSEKDVADVFGVSTAGFPLFPYNANAVRALADRFVRPQEQVEFNPRKILQHILREPLEHFRASYEKKEFPPAEFARIPCPGSLFRQLELNVRADVDRSSSLAAVWGHGAQSVEELAYLVSPEIAAEFTLPALSDLLQNTKPKEPTHPPSQVGNATQVAPGNKGQAEEKEVKRPPDPHAASREVDKCFEEGSIPQRVARVIRNAIVDTYDAALRDHKDWYGLNCLPKLRRSPSSQPLIKIPLNPNNPARPLITFGSEEEFSDRSKSQRYREFIVAVWRRALVKDEGDLSWDYESGIEDYCNYRNFIDEWLPEIISILVKDQREAAEDTIQERLRATAVFVPRLARDTLADKTNALVLTAAQIRERVRTDSGLKEWDEYITGALAEWDGKQSAWLDAFSTNRHAIEGDLIRSAIRGSSGVEMPSQALRAAQNARQEFFNRFSSLDLLDGCTTRGEFDGALNNLIDVVAKLNSTGQFKAMDDTTAIKYRNAIKRALDRENWQQIKSALQLKEPFTAEGTVSALHSFDWAEAEAIDHLLVVWKLFVDRNLARLQNENAEHGADRRKDVEDEFNDLLATIRVDLPIIEGRPV